VFSLVGTTNYSLAAGQSTTLIVGFTPDALDDFVGTLTLSGGESDVVMTLRGTGSVRTKRFSLFGCSPMGESGGSAADIAIMALALGVLVVGGRIWRRARVH